MDNQATRPVQPGSLTARGRASRTAVALTWALALFLIVDSVLCLVDGVSGRPRQAAGHRPMHYIALEELLYGISPRAAALGLPMVVLFLRATSGLTVAAVVVATCMQIATRGRCRIRAHQLVTVLIVSASCGAIISGSALVAATTFGQQQQFFAPPLRHGR